MVEQSQPVNEPLVMPPELVEAANKYNTEGNINALRELILLQKRIIIKNNRIGKKTPELFIKLPLSQFTATNGVVSFGDLSKPLSPEPINKENLPKNISEAKRLFKRGKINSNELSYALHNDGTKIEFWDASVDNRPGTNTNNSHTGFKKDCNFNKQGRFFQDVIKGIIRTQLFMAHKWWLKKYDKNAFVYDDPRLASLNVFLKGYVDNHIGEKADYRDYHMEMFGKGIDLMLGLAKEDIIYRIQLFDCINTFCDKIIFELTPGEQEHFDLWCHK